LDPREAEIAEQKKFETEFSEESLLKFIDCSTTLNSMKESMGVDLIDGAVYDVVCEDGCQYDTD